MRRVVVTGLGAVSPCGTDVESTWDAVCAGRSGIGPITRFDASELPTRIAGEVKGFAPERVIDPREIKRLDLFSQFALVAAHEAVVSAGLDPDAALGDRAGVYVGSGIGGISSIEDQALSFQQGGYRKISPFFLVRALTNLAAGHIAIRHGARGPNLAISTACATGNHSIGEAWRVIRCGDADLVLAGGSEAPIGPLGTAGFAMMRALSRRNEDPATASRPFDADRDGFVMAEGAGIVVVEALEHALARGARPLAELVGYGLSNDAFHVTAPPEGHEGAVRCMRLALASADLQPQDIGYINAHGTSTPYNDLHETLAIHTVFGEHARRLAVSSTKSVTGHLLGAAGGLEAVLTVLALDRARIPPTATLQKPGEGCDLDYVPGMARDQAVQAAMSNSFGFGGTNATLVFRRYVA